MTTNIIAIHSTSPDQSPALFHDVCAAEHCNENQGDVLQCRFLEDELQAVGKKCSRCNKEFQIKMEAPNAR